MAKASPGWWHHRFKYSTGQTVSRSTLPTWASLATAVVNAAVIVAVTVDEDEDEDEAGVDWLADWQPRVCKEKMDSTLFN